MNRYRATVIGIALILLISIIIVATCNDSKASSAENVLPANFEKIATQKINGNNLVELRHIPTGCHYTYMYNVSIEQIYDADNMPYCDKEE